MEIDFKNVTLAVIGAIVGLVIAGVLAYLW
jgi:hypothetical protein